MIKLDKFKTESRNTHTMQLDQMTPLEIARVMNEEDYKVVDAVGEVLPQIAQAITWAKEALEAGGRVIYFGAGTSGRLGVLDAVECPPTFGVEPGVVVGLIAGGEKAFVRAIEGAEDSQTLCAKELKDIGLCEKDLAIGLAASGRTPYVIGGLAYANTLGCKTIAVTANKGSEAGAVAQLAIEAEPGPEVLTGSTRLKAGTAEKLILNMISTGAMVGIGKVYQNLMVDVQQTNEKLVSRARNIVGEATGCSLQGADKTLRLADEDVKCAVVMLLTQVSADEARSRLQAARGHIREAIADV